ncbi:NAD(P)H-binding protein [Micromonospora matsumotoense]|uniref:NAD(P)H-binding protein n=1 Tax=Micromonospora matsumotoense TaxID=121616 RepID=UPI00342F1098
MSRVVVFGAGGRAGRAAVAEARRRGHQVTAVVRDPGAHGSLPMDGVRLVVGDAADPDSVAKVAAGHGAAISAVYDASARPDAFYPGVARVLLDGPSWASRPPDVVEGSGSGGGPGRAVRAGHADGDETVTARY